MTVVNTRIRQGQEVQDIARIGLRQLLKLTVSVPDKILIGLLTFANVILLAMREEGEKIVSIAI